MKGGRVGRKVVVCYNMFTDPRLHLILILNLILDNVFFLNSYLLMLKVMHSPWKRYNILCIYTLRHLNLTMCPELHSV